MTYAAIQAALAKSPKKKAKIKGKVKKALAAKKTVVKGNPKLRAIRLRNGALVLPSEEGYFIAETPAIARELKQLAKAKRMGLHIPKEGE